MPRPRTQSIVELSPAQAEFDTAKIAYAYAAGWQWHVCPIRRNSRATYKSAETNGTAWGATKDIDQVIKDFRHWPNAEIGIACGPSRILVIDIDSIEGHGVDGFASLAKLEAAHGYLPATYVSTTPHAGRHRWYVQPRGIKIRTKTIAPGVEIKAEGSMVAAPPASGRQWIERPGAELANLPDAWVDLIRDPQQALPRSTVRRKLKGRVHYWIPPDGIGDWRLDIGKGHDIPSDERLKCHVALKVLDADCSEPTWFMYGCCIYEGFSDEVGFDLFHRWSQRAGSKYKGAKDCRDKWKLIANGKRKLEAKGKKPRALGTIYDHASKIDPSWWETYDRLLRRRAKPGGIS
jgi:hypothetical protein